MNITGIITEFNPLHRGHEHILKAARENGADGIVCVMSGNFVQRGDAAIFNKFDRAECAVRAGADLIIELPVGYCLSSAQTFAYGGVALLESLGCVDTLMFGSECGDIELLKKTAAALNSVGHEDIKHNMSRGVSYAAAVGAALGLMPSQRHTRKRVPASGLKTRLEHAAPNRQKNRLIPRRRRGNQGRGGNKERRIRPQSDGQIPGRASRGLILYSIQAPRPRRESARGTEQR